MLIQPTGRKLLCVCQQPFWKRSRVKESKLSLNLEGGLCLSVIQYLKWRNTLINPGVWKALSQPFSSRLFQSLVAQMFKMNPYYVLSSFIKGCFYDNIFCATVLFFFLKNTLRITPEELVFSRRCYCAFSMLPFLSFTLLAVLCQLFIFVLVLVSMNLISPHVECCSVLNEVQMWHNWYLLIL